MVLRPVESCATELAVPISPVDRDAMELVALVRLSESVATTLPVELSPVDREATELLVALRPVEREATELLVALRPVEREAAEPPPTGCPFDSCDTLVESCATELTA